MTPVSFFRCLPSMPLIALLALFLGFGLSHEVAGQLTLERLNLPFIGGPVGVQNAGDGSGRLFVFRGEGVIEVIDDGVLVDPPFLALPAGVVTSGGGPEQGFLGVAFHPDYEDNGYFYVNYTNPEGDTEIARLQAVPPSSNEVDPATREVILTITQSGDNHNGGDLAFGPDGFLYIATGDGGPSRNNAQDLGSLLGKILRIDINDPSGYSIPADNPYVGGAKAVDGVCAASDCPEVWNSGLRNPWRFSFDLRNGDFYISDVGQSRAEEVNYQPGFGSGGENYGWPCREGFEDSGFPCPVMTTDFDEPILEYVFDDGGQAIIGGFVHRLPGENFGTYIFGDHDEGILWGAEPDGNGGFLFDEATPLIDTFFNITSFGVDEAGNIYLVEFQGNVHRLTEPDGLFTDGFEIRSTANWID